MIQIYVCQIERLEEELFNQLLSFLSKERQERILRFRHYEDRLRSMIGSLLMHMQVAKQLQCEPMKLKYRVNKFGKCELENNEIHFNISHAGQYAFCAISDRQVGIDIEHILFRDFSIFQSVWTEREKLLFQVNNMEDFYYLWTAKESYMKWLGTGLATDLQTVSIERNGIVYQNDKKAEVRVQHIRVHPQYICAVCSEYHADQVMYITIDELKTFYLKEEWNSEEYTSS